MTNNIDLDTIVLKSGGHINPSAGLCFMEAVAYFAGEKHSDHPACVSPIIGAFLRRWNDDLDNIGRQMLKPYITKVIGTAGNKEIDQRRGWMVTDWMIRTYLPAWLRLAGLNDQAIAVEGLPPLVDIVTTQAAYGALEDARSNAAAAWAAARDAAGAAARDAARAAARAAAWATLEPTKLSLQKSALELLDRMISA